MAGRYDAIVNANPAEDYSLLGYLKSITPDSAARIIGNYWKDAGQSLAGTVTGWVKPKPMTYGDLYRKLYDIPDGVFNREGFKTFLGGMADLPTPEARKEVSEMIRSGSVSRDAVEEIFRQESAAREAERNKGFIDYIKDNDPEFHADTIKNYWSGAWDTASDTARELYDTLTGGAENTKPAAADNRYIASLNRMPDLGGKKMNRHTDKLAFRVGGVVGSAVEATDKAVAKGLKAALGRQAAKAFDRLKRMPGEAVGWAARKTAPGLIVGAAGLYALPGLAPALTGGSRGPNINIVLPESIALANNKQAAAELPWLSTSSKEENMGNMYNNGQESSYLRYVSLGTKLGSATAQSWLEDYMYDKTAFSIGSLFNFSKSPVLKGLKKGGSKIGQFITNRRMPSLVNKATSGAMMKPGQIEKIIKGIKSGKIRSGELEKLLQGFQSGSIDSKALTEAIGNSSFGNLLRQPAVTEAVGTGIGAASQGLKPWQIAAAAAAVPTAGYLGYKAHQGFGGDDKPKVEVNHY